MRNSQGTVAVMLGGDIWVTDNFLAESPVWRFQGQPTPTSYDHWVVDPFSPGYRGVQDGAINGYVLSGIGHSVVDRVYKITDIFGSPSSETLFEILGILDTGHTAGAIACSFGRFFEQETDNPWIMVGVYSRGVNGNVRVWYSKDAGQTWSDYKIVTTHHGSTLSTLVSPAIHMSSKQWGRAFITAPIDSPESDEPLWGIYRTDDWGETWALDTNVSANPLYGSGGTLHFPWLGNDDEEIVYYGKYPNPNDGVEILSFRLYRANADGTESNVSPSDGMREYGPSMLSIGSPTFRVRTYDYD